MIEITPKDTRYVPLTQQRYCCVPTCIQMVMLRHNIPLVPAELIGYKMGLTVPEEDAKYFWHARTGERPPAGYGTQAGKPQYGPNAVFKSLKIPLKMSWSLIDKFRTYETFFEYLKKFSDEKDILVCYDWGTLFDKNQHNGHVCVLDKVDLKNETMRIIDPEVYAPKWITLPIRKMYEAMVYHGKKNSGGFWELSVTK